MTYSLVELPSSEWRNLRDMYKKKRNEPCSYNLLQNYIDWLQRDANMQVKIFTLSNDWRTDGTFVLIDADMKTPNVYFNTLSKDLALLSKMLHALKLHTDFCMNTISKRYLPVVKQYLFEKTASFNDIKYFAGNWYHLSRTEALKFNVRPPRNITLSKLKQEHAEKINYVWPHKGTGTINYIEKLISFNENIGAFDEHKNLVAWCLRTPLGAIGNVQVLETHRRLGLGSLLVRYMSKIIAAKNEDIMAPVKYDNIASSAMFEKLGFKAIDEAFCIEIPKKIILNDLYIL